MGITVLVVGDSELARVAAADVRDEVIARALHAASVSEPVTGDGLRGFLSGAAPRPRAARA